MFTFIFNKVEFTIRIYYYNLLLELLCLMFAALCYAIKQLNIRLVRLELTQIEWKSTSLPLTYNRF